MGAPEVANCSATSFRIPVSLASSMLSGNRALEAENCSKLDGSETRRASRAVRSDEDKWNG